LAETRDTSPNVFLHSISGSLSSAFKTRPSKLMYKLTKIKWREVLNNEYFSQVFNKELNPVVRFYVQSSQHSVVANVWKPLFVGVTLRGFCQVLALRLVYLLLGLVGRQYFDLIQVQPGKLMADTCLKPAIPYSAELVNPVLHTSLSMSFQFLKSMMSSVYGQILSSFVLLSLISLLLHPIISAATQHAASMWHFDQQLSSPWHGGMRSKFDFSEEAYHSVSLIQSVFAIFSWLLVALSLSIYLSSPVYLIVVCSCLWQLGSLVLLPSSAASRMHRRPSRSRYLSPDAAYILKNTRCVRLYYTIQNSSIAILYIVPYLNYFKYFLQATGR
jgi:hypothetical protein